MTQAAKTWLLLAAALVLVGGLMAVAALASMDWSFTPLGKTEYATQSFEIREDFHSLSVLSDLADVALLPAEDGVCRVLVYAPSHIAPSAAVQGNTLVVEARKTGNWQENIVLFTDGAPSITVYLPGASYAALTVETDTGDITLPAALRFETIALSTGTGDIDCAASAADGARLHAGTGDINVEGGSFGSLDLSVSTGRVELSGVSCAGGLQLAVSSGKSRLEDVRCASFLSSGSTGDLRLERLVAAGIIAIERSTGDVRLSDCDAAELTIQTSTGDVEGTLLTDKLFIAQSNTGRVRVPGTTGVGICRVTTNTGDVTFTVSD